ncbi:MAG: biliverdin-producing heme oxygenase [Rhodocyclaceae bacterium]|nr:biliverdin-producing heme oxygenase [Rhodocyclaceae bacterium]
MTEAGKDDFAALLRAATREAHHALDHHPLLAPLVRPGLNLADYGRALASLHAPQAALERLLAGFAPAADFPPRLAALEADLAALGLAPQPLRATPPEAADEAARIGLLYVLEGSNLGAAVIARQLARHLPDAPRAFFGGGSGAARWERFWRFVAAIRPDAAAAAQAARAACDFYRRHLDGCEQALGPSRQRRL